jgi:UDP-N-acetyl-D-glucosamine dehydrogenase
MARGPIVLLLTDHSTYDYAFTEKHARAILDTRNVFKKNGVLSINIYKT